jgi:predicted TIM-barrel fold metal-dependent hydrolase
MIFDAHVHFWDPEVRWAGELMTRDPHVRRIVTYAPMHLGASRRRS